MGWFSTFLTLFSVILLRNFLEGILEEAHTITLLEDVYHSIITNFIHFFFCYACIFLSITIVLGSMTRESIEKVLRTVATFSPVLLIPPIVDFFFSKGVGLDISYTTRSMDFLRILLAGPFYMGSIEGITPGMRIEVAAIYILVFLYAFGKGKGIIRALLTTLAIHLCVIVLVDLPHLIAMLAGKDFAVFYGPGSFLVRDTQKFGVIYLLLFSMLLLVTGLLFRRSFTKRLLKSIRYVRSINYSGAVLFGFLIGYALLREYVQFLFGNPWDYLAIISLAAAVFLSFCGAVVFNDIADVKTDSISRRRNPLASASIGVNQYRAIGIVFFVLGLLFALNTSYASFVLVLILILISFIYSSAPFRIKRVPLLGTFSLAFSTLLCLILGYSLFAGGRAFLSFPHRLQLLFLVSLTLGFTPKDLVDVEGDRAAKIFTIPVLFGQKAGRIVTFFLVCIGYLFVPMMIRSLFLTVLSLGFVLVTGAEFLMKRINEKLFLITYYLFSSMVVLFLFFNPSKIQQDGIGHLGPELEGDHFYEKRDYASSLITYSSIAEPGGAVLLKAGIAAFKIDKPREAVVFLKGYIRENPYHADAYSYLTNAYLKMGESDLASATNRTALERGLDLKRFLSERGILLFHSREGEKAGKYLHTSYLLGYRESSLLYYLAKSRIERTEYEIAESLLRRLIERDKNNFRALAELGKLKIEKEQYRESISLYRLALKIAKEPLFYNNIGVNYQRLGVSDSARICYERALALDPDYTTARKNLDNLTRTD